jgi:hypothetical protein
MLTFLQCWFVNYSQFRDWFVNILSDGICEGLLQFTKQKPRFHFGARLAVFPLSEGQNSIPPSPRAALQPSRGEARAWHQCGREPWRRGMPEQVACW